MGIDATDLFDRYEEDYEDVVGGGVPHVEINKMHISQSIEVSLLQYVFRIIIKDLGADSYRFLLQAPLTTKDTAVLSGSLSTHNGNGGGTINLALRRVTSAKGWGEVCCTLTGHHTHTHTHSVT